MGRIAAKDKQPSSKFVFPQNFDKSLQPNQPFTIKMAINNLATGSFVNPNTKYYAAPQVRYPFSHASWCKIR
jgi:transcription initiation factor TFIID subunit 15